MVSWIDVTENRHVGRRSHLRPKDTLAEVTFLSHNAAEYIEHAQLLAMDYPNMLTAVAVRNKIEIYLEHILISLSAPKHKCKISQGEMRTSEKRQ